MDEPMKIEPSKTPIIEGCPFCGEPLVFVKIPGFWECQNTKCVTYRYEILPEGVAAHKQLCRLKELGRQIDEVYKFGGGNAILEMNEYLRLGKAAEAFQKNPPLPPAAQESENGKVNETEVALAKGWEIAVRACLDMLEVEIEKANLT